MLIAVIFFYPFLIINKNSNNFEKYTTMRFVSKTYTPLFEFKSYLVIPTNYIEIKKIELFSKTD